MKSARFNCTILVVGGAGLENENQDKNRLTSDTESTWRRSLFLYVGHFCFASSGVQCAILRDNYAAQYCH